MSHWYWIFKFDIQVYNNVVYWGEKQYKIRKNCLGLC